MFTTENAVPFISTPDGSRILTPFGPMIYQTQVSESDIALLLEQGDLLSQESNDYNFYLAGNFKSGRSLEYPDSFRDRMAPMILDKAGGLLDGVRKVFGTPLPERDDLNLEVLWINYAKSGDFNPDHTHSYFLSFVIYCDVPQEIFSEQADTNSPLAGSITFNYGDQISPLTNTEFRVAPRNGMMFVFPALLRHIVYPFFAEDKTRISVSGNISVV